MTETPFFFDAVDRAMFGLLHQDEAQPVRTPFVFCHPFGEEKLWTHRVFVTFARALARRGQPVLRFDYRGSGDSEGNFSGSSLTSIRADVRSAVDELRRRTGAEAVNLLGLRFGGTIASLVAEEIEGIDRLILWAPIVDGARYMQELLRINLTTQMATGKGIKQDREAMVEAMRLGSTVNVDGYELAYPMFAEVSAVKLAAAPKRHAGPCLIVNVDRQPRPSPELEQLAATYSAGTLIFAAEEPFWKEIARFYDSAANLFAVTDEWLGREPAVPRSSEPASP